MVLLYSFIYELNFHECFAFSLFPKHGVYFLCKIEMKINLITKEKQKEYDIKILKKYFSLKN